MSIVVFVSDDPLNVTSDPENYVEGEPKFMGAILKNPGEELFNEWYNNHHHILEFNGKYYIMYHTTALDQFLYKDFYADANRQSLSYRNMHIDEIKVDVAGENPTIQIQPTYEGPEQTSYFNPYQEINATTQSHQGGLTRKIMDNGTIVLDNHSGGKSPVTSTSAPQQSVGTGKTERGVNVIKVGKPAVKSQSIRDFYVFRKEYFEDWDNVPLSCDSWLLSPALEELLDNDSNILNFQKLFKLESVDYDNVWYMGWVFPGYDSADENLPECTLGKTYKIAK